MRYFYVKVGHQNSSVRECLEEKDAKTVRIFFNDAKTPEDLVGKPGEKEVRTFIEAAKQRKTEATVMLVVHEGHAWFLSPTGDVEFDATTLVAEDGSTCKIMPVEVRCKKPLAELPAIIAGIPTNQYLARGTFREIKNDYGCKKAIDVAACLPRTGEHWREGENGADQLLECLGSLELETLIAKIFEAAGCYVPAHRGGTIKDIDLFAHNDSGEDLHVGDIRIRSGKGVSIQVKRWPDGKLLTASDWLIGVGVGGGDNARGSGWILERAQQYRAVWEWFARSLRWLPSEFREQMRQKLRLQPL